MTGPRPIVKEEIPSLGIMLDKVFGFGEGVDMLGWFPEIFSEINFENVLIFEDDGKVVSHVGMTERYASLAGCTVQVACIGAVATYEEYRGQGMASKLMNMACEKAIAGGADYMIISGGRGLYRRLGAADNGVDNEAVISPENAAKLTDNTLTVAEATLNDVPEMADCYRRRITRFMRPEEDWRWFFQSRFCLGRPSRLLTIRDNGILRGYFLMSDPDKENTVWLNELAGDEEALLGALSPSLNIVGGERLRIRLQKEDRLLREKLRTAGADITEVVTGGTIVLLNAPQLMKRLRPYFEEQVGYKMARTFRFTENGDAFTFELAGETHTIQGKQAATEFIFGKPGLAAAPGLLSRLFPLPTLWYGINFI